MDGRNEKNSGNRIRNCDLKFTDWILPSSRRLLDFLDIPHLNKLLDNLDIQNMPELSECLMSWTSGLKLLNLLEHLDLWNLLLDLRETSTYQNGLIFRKVPNDL